MKNYVLVLTSLASLAGCLVDDGADLDSGTDDSTDVARIATNGLSATTAFATLAALPLSNGLLSSSSIAALAADANGRIVLTYAVGCGLASGNSVTSNGYTFQGSVGAGAEWKTVGLNATTSAAVSGCFWARVNAHSKNINVSLRSNTIGIVGTEGTDYKVTEGAFFGNIFGSSVTAASCVGVDQLANETYGDLPDRDCTEYDAATGLTQCGFVYGGACASVCSGTGGVFTSCTVAGVTYNQPVSAFLFGDI